VIERHERTEVAYRLPAKPVRWDKWTRRDNKKWTRRDGSLTFDIRGAPESGPTARCGLGLR
jgi:hypothetical protein